MTLFLLLLTAAAGAPRAAVQAIERPDVMERFFLADVDRHGKGIRVLYQTLPSLQQQAADPDGWRINVYVVEVDPDGGIDQRLLSSKQQQYGALLLRRGHDEVIAVPAPGPPGSKPQLLESWSARDGELLSSAVVAAMPRVELGTGNIAPTDDGNLFVVGIGASGSRGESNSIVWHKLSPRGELLGKGEYRIGGATVGYGGLFPAGKGGVGLTVIAQLVSGGTRLDTDIDNPVRTPFNGRTLESAVHTETRLLVTDSGGAERWVSPALERTFMWDAGAAVPQDLPPDQKMKQTFELMELQEEIGIEYAARTIHHDPKDGVDTDLVKPTPSGYAVLADKTTRRDRVPPAHGPYYLEIGADGKLRRELYLEPLADKLGAREFTEFLPMADGGFLLAGKHEPERRGGSRFHVTRVGADGRTKAIVNLGQADWMLEALAGTSANAWLIGNRWSDEHHRILLQLQRVDWSQGKALDVALPPAPAAIDPAQAAAESSAPAKTTAAEAAPAEAAPPEFTPPALTDGCNCSCEEFTELQEWMKEINKLSDADKMKLVSDPAYVKRITCASQCAMAYAKCGG